MTAPTPPPTAAERATAPAVDDANRFALNPTSAKAIHTTAALLDVSADDAANGGAQFYAFIADLVAKGWTIAGIEPNGDTHPIEWSGFDHLNTEGEPNQP